MSVLSCVCVSYCLLAAAEGEISPSIEVLLVSALKEPRPDMIARVVSKGCAKALDDLLKKWPNQVLLVFVHS